MFNYLIKKLKNSWKIRKFLVKHCFYYNIYNLLKYKRWNFFCMVEIETINFCNRKCSWCPFFKFEREKKYMDKKIFFKIIDELAELNYSESIDLFLYSEPLLDPRIVEFVAYAKKKMPKAFVRIDTNGDLLTKELVWDLLSNGLDLCFINQYDGKISEHIKDIYDNLSAENKEKILIRVNNIFRNNRGGLLDIIESVYKLSVPCINPQLQLVIDVDGKAIICCDDFLSQVALGNVNNEKIIDIWTKKSYKKIRQELSKGNRDINDVCRRCNVRDNYVARILLATSFRFK